MRTRLHVQWRAARLDRRFRTGVSLHSHTHYSKESLAFLYKLAARIGLIDWAIRFGQRRSPCRPDFGRGWWTPPLVPRAAWELESRHIENSLGLEPLVSLTDHDSVEGPMSLRAVHGFPQPPISVEWTVPFGHAFLHLGIHNLPPAVAREAMSAMADYTARPRPEELARLLDWIHGMPETLVVLNHPHWDENAIGSQHHRHLVHEFLRRHGERIHAFELNGLRPWSENLAVLEMGRAFDKPVVSGGDRHGFEPNAVLNLSHASTFAEFVEEIRVYGRSEIFLTAHCRRPLPWRMFDTLLDVLGDYEEHGLGWTRWDDRIFYLCDDGLARSLRELWKGRPPEPVWAFVAVARALHKNGMQRTLRAAAAGQGNLAWQ